MIPDHTKDTARYADFPWYAALGVLLLFRIALQWWLYHSGFACFRADDFCRTVAAGQWAQNPGFQWTGIWLPFHFYLVGAGLWINWDLLHTPRVLAIVAGMVSIVLVFLLSRRLFHSRAVALTAAVLLAFQPVHVWLSSTPLSEIFHMTLIFATALSFVAYLQEGKSKNLYLSTIWLLLANGFRYEAWFFTIPFSLYLFCMALRIAGNTARTPAPVLVLAALIPCAFPALWMLGGMLKMDDPLYFFHGTSALKHIEHASPPSFWNYARACFAMDAPAMLLVVPAFAVCAWRWGRRPEMRWYLSITLAWFLVFAAFHGGRQEWRFEYFRYLTPFLCMGYPLIALLLVTAAEPLSPSPAVRRCLLAAILSLWIANQLPQALTFRNDRSAQGLEVGRAIRALRLENPALADKPVLVEAVGWEYLGIQVGANDVSLIYFDREFLPYYRRTRSWLLGDAKTVKHCIAVNRISTIVVKSPALQEAVAKALGIKPRTEVNGYAFFTVADPLP